MQVPGGDCPAPVGAGAQAGACTGEHGQAFRQHSTKRGWSGLSESHFVSLGWQGGKRVHTSAKAGSCRSRSTNKSILPDHCQRETSPWVSI